MSDRDIVTVLEPEDEFPHHPDEASNYNESMYLNSFDLEREVGGWFRLGNRVNEGYAEMSVCVYLPDGRIGFMFNRVPISTNMEMNAGGLRIDVVEPFEHLRVSYEGNVCVLDNPTDMADPKTAFRNNPHEACSVELDIRGVSPMYGGKPMHADGTEITTDATDGFARAHYEQHTSSTGSITVGDETLVIDGLGLRDKSWGPRYWQAVSWYRWLPMVFGPDFALMLSVVSRDGVQQAQSGMVLEDGAYTLLQEVRIDSEVDSNGYQTAMTAWCRTDNREYEIEGEVLSLIPLRNRRTTPDGEKLTTRITEAMTRYTCDGRKGIGMSEYLDQIVDGKGPVGPARTY